MVDYDEVALPTMKLKPKSVVQLYLAVYATAFIIGAVNILVSRDRYITSNM